ncbi:thermonuclease family protein [Candidatus Woesearchaeota archaeon]|nr:thermonuclease family protein [Candidatus Woesearchaeota archaeon]
MKYRTIKLLLSLLVLALSFFVIKHPDQTVQKITGATAIQTGEHAIVFRIVDGDTVQLKNGDKVRLLGINTPEHDQLYYQEAKDYLKELIEGKEVVLQEDKDTKDKYGRLLRYILLDGKNINVEMVEQGYATEYVVQPNVHYEKEFDQAWKTCLQNKIRLCKPALSTEKNCGSDCVYLSNVHPTASGDACRNLNDEYISLGNQCERNCNLTGWTVKDASSRTPYTFPELSLAANQEVSLHTGCSINTANDMYWCNSGSSCNTIWNDDTDTVLARNVEGNLVFSYTYPQ